MRLERPYRRGLVSVPASREDFLLMNECETESLTIPMR